MNQVVEEIEITTRNISEELLKLLNSTVPFTDLLIKKEVPVLAKLPSGWEEIEDFAPFTDDELKEVVKSLDNDFEATLLLKSINRPLNLNNWRLRVNAYLANSGGEIMMSIRRIPVNPPLLKDTGLPPAVRLLLAAPRGLIFVSGATASGKTTTVAALIEEINITRKAHIITIEDPIEFQYIRKQSAFSQREVGVDTPSFYEGARDAMRQCPNVIVIGEIRDKETAETALLAGESGHLVIATLHANSAAGTVQKLLGFFNADERASKAQTLSTNLVGIINQILLPKLDNTGYVLATELLANHKQQYSKVLDDTEKLAGALERKEDGVSITITDSLVDLVQKKQIARVDAINAVFGSPALFDKLKNLQ